MYPIKPSSARSTAAEPHYESVIPAFALLSAGRQSEECAADQRGANLPDGRQGIPWKPQARISPTSVLYFIVT